MTPVQKAWAQGVTGETVFSQIQAQNISGAANTLVSTAASQSGLNLTQATQIVQNLSTIQNMGQLNTQAATRLLSGVISGTVSGQLGTALSTVTNLGNISSVSGVTSLLTNPSISSLFQSITTGTAGIQQATQLLSTVLNISSAVSTLSQIISNPTSLISGLIGNVIGNQIVNALAGLGGLTSSLPSAATQALAATNTQQAATQAANNNGGSGGGGTSTCPTCTPCCRCAPHRASCGTECACTDAKQLEVTVEHITDEFIKHREWLITVLWNGHVLPGMMLMAEQLTTMAMHQMLALGMILDAKHQQETQRLFQTLHAEAHKDYSVSEGMCEFGTSFRSMAASDRNAEFSQSVIASRGLQRQLLSGDTLAGNGPDFDLQSRMEQFRNVYCNPKDLQNISRICKSTDKTRWSKDIDFTNTVSNRETLQIDFTPDGDRNHSPRGASFEEEDILALGANLYGSNLVPIIPANMLIDNTGQNKALNAMAITDYMELRSLAAKRSVAQNSFAAIAGMKAQGPKADGKDVSEVQPYLKALLVNMGIPEQDVQNMLGDRPSYYAQMEILTRKLYQNPVFYADLYDKPANIDRKDAAMRAIGSIQQRDMFRSWLRAEAVTSVWLEVELQDHEDSVRRAVDSLVQTSDLIDLGK
ncbi:MAG: hypothetical protein J0L77_01605 [Alphaproteobacteria bacterium]|nr:hypothetical protein [Alphaproteobacteria bacterium]